MMNNFLKTYKLSEQQILNPKVLSVANSCDENPYMAKIVYRQVGPTPKRSPPPGKN